MACALLFASLAEIKFRQISGFEFRAASRQLWWMKPLIIWEIYSSFFRFRRLEMRTPLFLLLLTAAGFGVGPWGSSASVIQPRNNAGLNE